MQLEVEVGVDWGRLSEAGRQSEAGTATAYWTGTVVSSDWFRGVFECPVPVQKHRQTAFIVAESSLYPSMSGMHG